MKLSDQRKFWKVRFLKTAHIRYFSGPNLEKILKSWVSKNCSYHPVTHLRAEKSCHCHRKKFIYFILRPSLETSSETLPESREELIFFYQDMGILPAKISGYCHEHYSENVKIINTRHWKHVMIRGDKNNINQNKRKHSSQNHSLGDALELDASLFVLPARRSVVGVFPTTSWAFP